MFTGIIESIGVIARIMEAGTNRTFWVTSELSDNLKVDESLSHNGVCLTVEEISGNEYRVTAIEETLKKSALASLKKGDHVNLERSLLMNGRLDGHIVQGHVDGTGICTAKKESEGSVEFTFSFPEQFAPLLIEKGSICVNGVSLTAFDVTHNSFTVAIIPHTLTHTNFQYQKVGETINLEFDILGKYVQRLLYLQSE
jgi:riboflavin synthase